MMVNHKYGTFEETQLDTAKSALRKSVYFCLLVVEKQDEYKDININDALEGIMYKLEGYNSLFNYPSEIVDAIACIERARIEINSKNYNYKVFRKLILDAGANIQRIKGV